MKFRVTAFLLFFALLAGCTDKQEAGTPASHVADDASDVQAATASPSYDSFEAAFAAANKAMQAAADRGHAWLSVDNLLAQAREAAQAGDEQQAIALAIEASKQARLAREQADTEQDAWRERVVTN